DGVIGRDALDVPQRRGRQRGGSQHPGQGQGRHRGEKGKGEPSVVHSVSDHGGSSSCTLCECRGPSETDALSFAPARGPDGSGGCYRTAAASLEKRRRPKLRIGLTDKDRTEKGCATVRLLRTDVVGPCREVREDVLEEPERLFDPPPPPPYV